MERRPHARPAARAEHQFRAGDRVSGEGAPVADTRHEVAEFYEVSKLKVLDRGPEASATLPPWFGVPPGELRLTQSDPVDHLRPPCEPLSERYPADRCQHARSAQPPAPVE